VIVIVFVCKKKLRRGSEVADSTIMVASQKPEQLEVTVIEKEEFSAGVSE
jgi:hypothetical protein